MTKKSKVSFAAAQELGLHHENPTVRTGWLIHFPLTQHFAACGEHGAGLNRTVIFGGKDDQRFIFLGGLVVASTADRSKNPL